MQHSRRVQPGTSRPLLFIRRTPFVRTRVESSSLPSSLSSFTSVWSHRISSFRESFCDFYVIRASASRPKTAVLTSSLLCDAFTEPLPRNSNLPPPRPSCHPSKMAELARSVSWLALSRCTLHSRSSRVDCCRVLTRFFSHSPSAHDRSRSRSQHLFLLFLRAYQCWMLAE